MDLLYPDIMQWALRRFTSSFVKRRKRISIDTTWKKGLKVRKPYQLDTSKASEEIAPQSREILPTFVSNDYSRVKEKLMMLNNHREEVEGIIQQYYLSVRLANVRSL